MITVAWLWPDQPISLVSVANLHTPQSFEGLFVTLDDGQHHNGMAVAGVCVQLCEGKDPGCTIMLQRWCFRQSAQHELRWK